MTTHRETTDPEAEAMLARTEATARLREELGRHLATASPVELAALIDALEDALARRLGTYRPFLITAVYGIRDSLKRAGLAP